MPSFRHLVREIHRRSIWQVLSIYLVGSWGALQVVEGITDNAGLPDWVPPFALVLLVIGLPIVLSTAIVQEGMPGTEGDARSPEGTPADGEGSPTPDPSASTAEAPAPNLAAGTGSLDRPSIRPSFLVRHLTWKRAILGGVLAFTLLGVSVGAYFFMRSAGIGPVASLAAQGVFDERERVILADFLNRTGDEGLGDVVTEAFRVDLIQSSALSVADEAYVAEVLRRMERESAVALTSELAREVAVRDGIEAIIQGEVGRAGEAYVFSASIVASADGRTLAAFRETAEDDSELLDAIDRLSQDVREKAGESLRSIKSEEPLERVTTESLPALRLHTQASQAFNRGDFEQAISLAREAIELDPDFGMAWRLIAIALNNTGIDRAAMFEAARRTYELRERMPPLERHLGVAFYHQVVTQDQAEIIAAYRRVLAIDPDQRAGLNNLANVYGGRAEYEEAAELYRQAVNGPGVSTIAFQNLIQNRVAVRDFAEAREMLERWRARYPENIDLSYFEGLILVAQGDPAGALAAVQPTIEDINLPVATRTRAMQMAAMAEVSRGRIGAMRSQLESSRRLAAQASPAYAWVRTLWLAWYESWVGNPDRARDLILEARRDGTWDGLPAGARFPFFAAMNLALVGEVGEARAINAEWLEETSADERGRNDRMYMESALAYARVWEGEPQEAAELLQRVRENDPCDVCYIGEIASAHWEAGNLEEAAREMEAALLMPEAFPEVAVTAAMWSLERLGPLYEELGDTARALDAYQRFIDRWAQADDEGMQRVRAAQSRIDALIEG